MAHDIVHRDETLVIARDGRLLMPLWWNAPTLSQMQTIAEIAARMDREGGAQTAYAQFVLAGTPIFSSEVRQIAETLTRNHFTLGIAHVIEIGGLTGAATRAFLGGLLLIGRDRKPMKVFGDIPSAATWIAERTSAAEDGWTAERVIEVRLAAEQARP